MTERHPTGHLATLTLDADLVEISLAFGSHLVRCLFLPDRFAFGAILAVRRFNIAIDHFDTERLDGLPPSLWADCLFLLSRSGPLVF